MGRRSAATGDRVRQPIGAAVVLSVLLGVSGCIWMGGSGASLSESDKLNQQAQAALTRWANAVGTGSEIVLVGDLTAQVGDWEESVGDNNKQALYAGLVQAGVGLPPTSETNGTVLWSDGTTAGVRVVSAEQALAGIRSDPQVAPCSGSCLPLIVTSARLTSGTAETSRGSALVPMWAFTLRGTAVTLTRVAIANPVTVGLAPWTGVPWGTSGDAPVGIAIDAATATSDGRGLTVSFVGSPLSADQPCGADYTAEAVESSTAVVVIVTEHPNPTPGACAAVGARRTASVALASPLGARTVLEVTYGRPIAVTQAL